MSSPPLPHGFVDRRVQIAKALRALRYRPNRAPLLVVTGLPGVGKTAFALVVPASYDRMSIWGGWYSSDWAAPRRPRNPRRRCWTRCWSRSAPPADKPRATLPDDKPM